MENRRSKDNKVFRKVLEAIEAKARKIRMGKTKERRKERRRRKEARRERGRKKKEEETESGRWEIESC